MRPERILSKWGASRRWLFERGLSLALILALLGGGLLLARHVDEAPPLESSTERLSDPDSDDLTVFRNWLWERRGLDLLVQVALVFAGTLGVAAILPHSSESTGSSTQV